MLCSCCCGQDLQQQQQQQHACTSFDDGTCSSAGTSLSLLQRAAGQVQAHSPAAPAPLHRGQQLLELAQASEARRSGAVDCTATPALCSGLLRCDKEPFTNADELRMLARIADSGGHANLRSWCASASVGFATNIVQHCLVNHDLKTSAQLTYKHQVASGAGDYDGSYCFMEGHCDNTEVTYDTTLEEAEAMCDRRYPGWNTFGLVDVLEPRLLTNLFSDFLPKAEPGLSPRSSRFFAKTACAMGNYHCDVIYCRDTYCKMDYYKNRFAHLAPKQ